jgi:hypothetical protein
MLGDGEAVGHSGDVIADNAGSGATEAHCEARRTICLGLSGRAAMPNGTSRPEGWPVTGR